MTPIVLDVPKSKEVEYKKILNNFIMTYSIDELREIENINIDLQRHNLEDLSKENISAYKNSFNVDENNLINI